MTQGRRVRLSANQRTELWSRWKAGQVALISKWYGYVEGTNEINATREPTKIADVLLNFRDRP